MDIKDIPGIPVISIHAPREGSDQAAMEQEQANWNFNPRSP